jgi:hypothetical protein
MHPRHASTPLSGWAAVSWQDARHHLPRLVAALTADARAHGIERLLLQTRAHDWVGGAFWWEMGMRPDIVLAGLTLPVPRQGAASRHPIRTATLDDAQALVRLAFDEYEYHAAHTRSGTRADQPVEPTVREIASAFEERAAGKGETFVIDGADGPVGSLRTMILELPADSPGRAYLPSRYGYIGLTSVAPGARGTPVSEVHSSGRL